MGVNNKKGFILYADQKALFDKLPNEKAGELIKFIFAYVNDEQPETDDLIIDLAFTPIKQQFKRDLEKWEETREKRSKAGKASAEARRNKRQHTSTNSTYVKSVEHTSTNSTVNVNDKVKVNVNDKVIKVYSDEVNSCYNNSIEFFPKILRPDTQAKKNRWLDTIDKLNRIDKLDFSEIEKIIEKGRNGKLSKDWFHSMTKLRTDNRQGVKYWKVFQLSGEKPEGNGRYDIESEGQFKWD